MMQPNINIILCLVYFHGAFAFVPFPNRRDDSNICCIQDAWEAHLFFDSGTVFIDQNTAFAYFNGTIHTAYSYESKKLYFGIAVTEQSPLTPHPNSQNKTMLLDYTMNITYSVTDGKCEKDELDGPMQTLCIPNDATLLSSGKFGAEGRPLETYQFTEDSDIPWQITATVSRDRLTPVKEKLCNPFRATYFLPSVNPDSGTLYSYDVMDFGPITSHNIFDIPEPCRHLV